MQCGFFRRGRSGLTGEIGPLRLAWDRSGRLSVGRESSSLGLQFGTAGTVLTADGASRSFAQAHEEDPQWIFVEEGPQRLALRVRYALYDEDGNYHGDGLQNVFAYPNGDLFLAFAIGFADQAAHRSIGDAWLSACPTAMRELCAGDRQLNPAEAMPIAEGHPLLLTGDGQNLAVAWYDESGGIAAAGGPAGPWVSGDRPPFYERWGDLYDQWPDEPGWSPEQGAQLLCTGEEIRWVWRSGCREPAGIIEGHRALLHLRFDAEREALVKWAGCLREPVEPEAHGARYRYWHALDGTYAFRKDRDADEARLVFPADPAEREVHVCLFDLRGTGGVQATMDGQSTVAQTVSLGGRLDDPLGSNLGRVDDFHGPVLTDPGHPPFELFLSTRLSADRPTEIGVREGPGVALSYQRWDDRRQLTLTSSTAPGRSLGQLAVRDGKFRDITKPSGAAFGIAQIPHYWFKANALTPFHYVNQPERLEILENGPQQVVFRYTSTNTGKRARSEQRVRVWVEGDAVRFDIDARFEVLERWDLSEIQFLNIFPCYTVYPEVWHHDQFILADSTGRCMHYLATLPRDQAVRGDELWEPRGDLFFAEFASDRGNMFVLVRDLQPADLTQRYQICAHWLDSHFHVDRPAAPLDPGTCFSVHLEIALGGDASLTAEQARGMAERSLKEGRLLL